MPPTTDDPGGAGEFARRAVDGRHRLRLRPGHRHAADELPRSTTTAPTSASSRSRPCRRCPQSPTDGLTKTSKERRVPTHTFILNGKQVSVDCRRRRPPAVGAARPARRHRPEVRLRPRRLPGLHQPHQRQGVQPLLACRSSQIKPTDQITTIEGLPATVGKPLHPMQQAWLDDDVAQCGYCQPGQIMAAVALVKQVKAAGPRDHRRRPRRDPQRLPLRHLPAHPRGDQAGLDQDVSYAVRLARSRVAAAWKRATSP